MKAHKFLITKAKYIHAEDIYHVLIKSIKELCLVDHQNDPTRLEDWLHNKTPENIKIWIENSPENFLVALNEQKKIVGVSMISHEGKILLNYLLPDYIGKGVGKLMLNEMELLVKKANIKKITAISTITALPFYKKNGFQVDILAQANSSKDEIPIIKILAE